jgi:hypothetical protein
VEFARDMFPGVSTEDIGVWPADDGELVVSVRAVADQLQRIEPRGGLGGVNTQSR